MKEALSLRINEALKEKDLDESIKMKLIVMSFTGTMGIVATARATGHSRNTIRVWLKKFNEGGAINLAIKAGRGRKSKLSTEQKAKVYDFIVKNGPNLIIKKVRLYIEETFNIPLVQSTTWELMRELGFSHITPRPQHHKQDPVKQEEYKKKWKT